MTTLPIVTRELRVASRRSGLYWNRLIFGGIAILAEAYFLLITSQGGIRTLLRAKTFFYMMVGLAVLYSLIAGARSASDCVSREKREGTLGLLFLTDLKGYDVVIGKLASNGLTVFYGFLAIFPVLGVAFLLGGVTGGEFFRVTLAMLNLLFMALAAGMVTSTLLTKARPAFYYAAAFLYLLLVVSPPVGQELIQEGYSFLGRTLVCISPITPLHDAGIPMGHYNYFWTDLFFSNLFGWGLLGFASWKIPNCWQTKNSRLTWRERLAQFGYGNSKIRSEIRKRLVDKNPYYWLISRKRFGRASVWCVIGLTVLIYATARLWNFYKPVSMIDVTIFIIFSLSHLLLLTWIASVASMHLDEFRRDGSLEFLLCATPITESEILNGQWLGLKRLFLGPFLVLMAGDLLQFWEFYMKSNFREEAFGILFIMTLFLISVVPAIWIAMWVGVSSSKPGHGAGSALFKVLIIPLLISGFMLVMSRGGGGHFGIFFLFICAIMDSIFWVSAYSNLKDNLRKMAVPPMNDRGSFWNTTARQVGEAIGLKS